MTIGGFGKEGGSARKHGANCLHAGTIIFFIFSFFVWLFCIIMFLSGGFIQELGCKTLEDPANSELYVMFEDEINEQLQETFGVDNVTWSLPQILEDTKNDKGVYEVFKLEFVYNVAELENWEEDYNVTGIINEVERQVDEAIQEIADATVVDSNVQTEVDNILILFNETNQVLDAIGNFDSEDVFDPTFLTDFETKFNESVEQLPSGSLDAEVAEVRRLIEAAELDATEFINEVDATQTVFSDFQETVLTDDAGNPIDVLLTEAIDMALELSPYIENTVAPEVDAALNVTEDNMLSEINEYVDYSIGFVYSDLGHTRPIYNIYFGVVNSVCYEVVDPYNWMWAGLGLLLVVSIPMLVLACNLNGLFRRADSFGQDGPIMARVKNEKAKRQGSRGELWVREGWIRGSETNESFFSQLPSTRMTTGCITSSRSFLTTGDAGTLNIFVCSTSFAFIKFTICFRLD